MFEYGASQSEFREISVDVPRGARIFRFFSGAGLERLVAARSVRQCAWQEVVFEPGDRGQDLYIMPGRVAFLQPRPGR